MFLLFARHGETPDNRNRVFQGQRFPGPALNRLGRAQAARLAERLRGGAVQAIVASDLARAAETAGIVAEAVGLPVSFDPDLREVDVGTWTGRSYEEVSNLFPEEYAAWAAGLDARRGGGETYGELALRVERAASRVATVDSVLFVSHGGAIKSYVAKILGVSSEGLRALAGVRNCGLTVIERLENRRLILHAWNDTSHLEGLVVAEPPDGT